MDTSLTNSTTTTTTTPRPTPYEKSAEFARLYYFFEKLTQPRSRRTSRNHHHHRSMSHEESETAAADAPIPEDFVPLLKNLSAILTKDEPFDHHGDGETTDAELLEASDETQACIPATPTTATASTFAATTINTTTRPVSPSDHASMRPRRNTVASSALASGSARTLDVASRHVRTQTQTRFPLREKRYPFTFKLLLHKLYDLEDWAAKVQEVLAASQEQFRSLNTTSPTSNNTSSSSTGSGGSTSGGGGVPCSPVSPGTTFSGSLFGRASSPPTSLESPSARRRRAQSTSKTKANNDAGAGAVLTRCSGGGGTVTPSRPPRSSRAVKKRIVNRRRSTNGLGGEDVVGKMGEWMYDAAVSSVDAEQVDARGKDDSLRRRKRVLSSVEFVEEERRFVGRDVTNVSF